MRRAGCQGAAEEKGKAILNREKNHMHRTAIIIKTLSVLKATTIYAIHLVRIYIIYKHKQQTVNYCI